MRKQANSCWHYLLVAVSQAMYPHPHCRHCSCCTNKQETTDSRHHWPLVAVAQAMYNWSYHITVAATAIAVAQTSNANQKHVTTISNICDDRIKYHTNLTARERNGGQQPVQRAAGGSRKHATCVIRNDRQHVEQLITRLRSEQMEGVEWGWLIFVCVRSGRKVA